MQCKIVMKLKLLVFNVKLNSESCIEYFKKLIQLNHDAFCYLFYHPDTGVWIGASPEKLLNLNNNVVTTFALAATKKDMNQSWTDKEFREQKIVEEQIVADLKGVCTNIERGTLQTVKAGNLFHLKSVIKAQTKKSSSDLIKLLHPTKVTNISAFFGDIFKIVYPRIRIRNI